MRDFIRRDLRFYRGLAAAGGVFQSPLARGQLHQHPRRPRLSGACGAEPNKPIRVLLQDGKNDLDNPFGNWWLANLQMESSLKFKHYDYKFVGGDGGHNGKQGGAILPESLRWLWRPADVQ